MAASTLALALLKVQADAPHIAKSDEVDKGKYSYRYAPLDKIFAVYLPLLRKHGILLSQKGGSKVIDGKLYASMITLLVLAEDSQFEGSGEMFYGPITSAHDLGGALQYMRRYQFNAMMCISPAGEDDDAVDLMQNKDAKDVALTGKLAEIKTLIESTGTDVESTRAYYKVAFLDELTDKQMSDCIELLKIRLARQKAPQA